MKTRRIRTGRAAASACAAILAGCAGPASAPPDRAAVEQARREERQQIMRDYWYDRTLAPVRQLPSDESPPLAYPAGTYSGINFGPRSAPGPGLAEPAR